MEEYFYPVGILLVLILVGYKSYTDTNPARQDQIPVNPSETINIRVFYNN